MANIKNIGGCILTFIASACIFVSCNKPVNPDPDPSPTETETQKQYRCVNTFAYNVLKNYYLWNKEISDDLKAWTTYEEPIAKVKAIRYKDSVGDDIDKWTTLTDDYASFSASVAGTGKTYGFDYSLYYADAGKTNVNMVVTYVYADSPAAKAGLVRGSAITEINGTRINTSNYKYIISDQMMNAESCTITVNSGSKAKMTAAQMYENPVQTVRTLEVGAQKVAYLHFTSFTPDCYKTLIDAFKQFKADGVAQMVLDLRYNTGGLADTEHTLASMLAPESVVKAGSLYETTVYNDDLTAAGWGGSYSFSQDFSFTCYGKQYEYSTAGANLNLDKLYVLTSGSTASASECLITCLTPYIPIVLIGKKTYGKYCSGIIYSADDWYDDVKSQLSSTQYTEGKQYSANWGIYVMIGRFADKYGKTGCMPNGFKPDHEVDDNPQDGYQLGDPKETMLAAALKLIGGSKAAAASADGFSAGSASAMTPLEGGGHSSVPGRIVNREIFNIK